MKNVSINLYSLNATDSENTNESDKENKDEEPEVVSQHTSKVLDFKITQYPGATNNYNFK